MGFTCQPDTVPCRPNCLDTEMYCPGWSETDPGFCIPRQYFSSKGRICSSVCDQMCDYETSMFCPGDFDPSGCMGPGTCVGLDEECPANTMDSRLAQKLFLKSF